jgi:hypothetical protein
MPHVQTPPDPRTTTLIAAFREKYLSLVGNPYPTKDGKDQALLKRLLAAGYDVSAVQAAMDQYFASDFYSRHGFDVGKFTNAFAAIISAGAKKRLILRTASFLRYDGTGFYTATKPG